MAKNGGRKGAKTKVYIDGMAFFAVSYYIMCQYMMN